MAPLETSNVELQPLKISIVGAGLAGLAAAIALRRNGHIVQIFESAKVTSEIGAAIVVPVNSQRVLERFGYSRENLKSVPFDAMVYFDSKGGEGTTNSWLIPLEKQVRSNLLCHRSDLHAELERLAVGPGEGPPAVLYVASQVVGCDTEQGSLTLKDGQVIHGDVVLGADGISSTIRTHVLGYLQKSLGSGWSCYRAVLDTSKLPGPPALSWLRDGASGLRMVPLRGSPFRMLLTYPCRSGTLLNFVAIYDDPNQDDPGLFFPPRTPLPMQEAFAQFHEQFQPLLAALPDRLGKWQMRTLPVLPTWVRARAALLGDAAHATMPSLGQGAAMAVEDAGALGALFPAGTARADVPARLAAYEALRKPRGEWVGRESLEQAVVPKQRGAYSRSKEMQQYMMEYDAVKAAEEYYQERFGTETIGE
ncbi:FAD/NAD(P)-binding domain-containing protein [Mycena vulgaris]|nr:FAD/NAD(P)-binding domain-containing protein [Mycena vulgaris]